MAEPLSLSAGPAPCFTPLSTRVLPALSAGPALAAWCPTQDLLAIVIAAPTTGSQPPQQTLHIHRLNWNRILAQEMAPHAGVNAGTCAVTAMAWRPDGKALALACRCGRASLLSIETRTIVDVWRPSEGSANANDGSAAITCMRWIEAAAGSASAPTAASVTVPSRVALQALYLAAQGAAPRGLRRAMQHQEALGLAAAGDSFFALSQGPSSTGAVAASSSAAAGGGGGLSLPPTERLPLYMDPLPSLEGALDVFQALALPSGVAVPVAKGAAGAAAQQAHHSHRSARHAAAGSSAAGGAAAVGAAGTGPPGSLRGILHDALDSSSAPNLLMLGDAAGRFWIRAAGTLDVLTGSIGTGTATAVLSMDWSPISGCLSIVGRDLQSHRIQLRSLSVPLLLTHSPQLTQLVQSLQQLSWVVDYVRQCVEALGAAWKAARKSFDGKMQPLQEVIDELAEERREALRNTDADAEDSEAEENEPSDPVAELLQALLSGLPSHALHAFISRNLSAGNLTKSFDGLSQAAGEVQALASLCLQRGTEQLAFRAEQIRGMSCGDEFAALGLSPQIGGRLADRAGQLWLRAQKLVTDVGCTSRRFSAFAPWFLSLVRLVNNEHENSPAPGADASELERDGQLIPAYGPFDSALVAEFVRHELQQDRIGMGIGDIKSATAAAAAAQAKHGNDAEERKQEQEESKSEEEKRSLPSAILAALAPVSAAPSGSLADAFVALRSELANCTMQPRSVIAAASSAVCIASTEPVGSAEAADASAVELFTASPFTRNAAPPAAAEVDPASSVLQSAHNVLGSSRTLALRHRLCTASSAKSHAHRAAFLWEVAAPTQEEETESEGAAPATQFVSVVSYRSASAASPATGTAGVDAQPKHLTILVPSVPHASLGADDAQWSSSVVSVQWYDDATLQILVQYESLTAAAAAAADSSQPQPSQVASKLWMVDVDGCDAEWWSPLALASPAQSVVACIRSQLASASAEQQATLLSLLPVDAPSSSPFVVQAEAPSRARLFPALLAGHTALNGQRGLAALLVAGRAPPPPAAAAASSADDQAALLLQLTYKPTRRVLLLDMQEDPEVSEAGEPETPETAEAAGGMEEEAAAADDDDADDDAPASMDDSTASQSTPAKARSSLGPSTVGSSRKASPASMSSPMLLSLLLFLLALACDPLAVHASEGDRDMGFRLCLDVCSSRCRLLDEAVLRGTDPVSRLPYPADSDPFAVLPASVLSQWDRVPLPSGGYAVPGSSMAQFTEAAIPRAVGWVESRLLRWDCAANCGYQCMHANEARRAAVSAGEAPVWKYYGKWPFARVFGVQELFSSGFSVLNAVPHLYWLLRLRREFSAQWSQLSMAPLWSLYALVYVNTWLWSTVFHARDLLWTERLDYFCASAGIAFSLCVVLIRMLEIRGAARRIVLVFVPVGLGLAAHIGYLQWIHFDYGWNMRVSLSIGLLHSALWIIFVGRRWSDGYHARIVVVTLGLWAAAALEVFDFPPFGGLLDAHAIWHGLTPALSYVFYQWVRDDLKFTIKLKQEERNKQV